MSGTSLDGVDGVVLEHAPGSLRITQASHLAMPRDLRQTLLGLNAPGHNELHTAALATNQLMQCHAQVVQALLASSGYGPSEITAIGLHGQTVRHQPGPVGATVTLDRPWHAYTIQLGNPALLAELTGIPVVADFRSRDVAAGGQGAPLVPAFHKAIFGRPGESVAVVNVGGMANATLLGAQGEVTGFDSGPGNVLMDLWCEIHTGKPYDADGAWAASGQCHAGLLATLLSDPFFSQTGARSTGRERFNREWLETSLASHPPVPPADVQATLLALTSHSIAASLPADIGHCVVCGGGALNAALMADLQARLPHANVKPSDAAGMPATQVEAAAFAWLASQTWHQRTGNVPAATGARGERVLGAVYAA